MAKKKKHAFYAWKAPGGAGIYETWEECQGACAGFRGERHQGFETYEEAWCFAYPDTPLPKSKDCISIATADGMTIKDTRKEDGSSLQSQRMVPFTDIDIAVSDEVNQYCAKYGFEKLSNRQRMAVQSVNGKTLLLAVPGSGKTTVIIARTGFMVYSQKIDPNSIISLTFTKAAANEMTTRYKAHFKTGNAPDFRTIHSLCYSIILPMLCRSGYSFPSHLLGTEEDADGKEKPRTATEVFRILFKAIGRPCKDFETAMETVQCVITGIKNSIMQPSEFENLTIKIESSELNVRLLFDTYQKIMQDFDCMDYDDLLACAYKGLIKYPYVLQQLRQKYVYWNVDEAQDTSKLQFKLLDLLCGTDGNMFMVGDDDQSIYSFRGANPELLLDFGHRSEVTTLLMGHNYRSDSEIVAAAKSFIKENQNRFQKEMVAFSHQPGFINIPQAFRTEVGQYEFIVQAAKDAVSKNETLAVLYRRNISGFPLAVYLHHNDIPYEANKGVSELLRSKQIKGIWKVLLFLNNPYSFSHFSSCHTYLNIHLKKEEIDDLKATYAGNNNIPVLELVRQKYRERDNLEKSENVTNLMMSVSQIRKLPPTEAVKSILSDILFWSPESISDRLRVYSFLSACDLFQSINDFTNCVKDIISAEKKADAPDATDIYNSLSYISTTQQPVVTISSMHSSKGREFSRVIIIDSFDEIMPGKKREDALIYAPEEELRLFYVAVTRASHRLDLLTVDKYHGNSEKVSSFIGSFAFLCEQKCINSRILGQVREPECVRSGPITITPAKYYAVKNGRKPGIYTVWSDCQSQVQGYSGAEYKSFSSREEAEEYLEIVAVPDRQPLSLRTIDPHIIRAEGVAFNYPMDIPAQVCASVHSRFEVSSLEQLAPDVLARLREQSNNMYSANQSLSYHASAEAYLLAYMPVNFYKIWKPLCDLADAGELKNTCRVLELGAGPGTSTMGLISFFSELAISNPETMFKLDITAIEKEKSFRPIFEDLTSQLSKACPKNLSVCCRFIVADVMGDVSAYNEQFDMVIESNMLNQAEGMDSYAIEILAQVLSKTLSEQGLVVLIEPGTNNDLAFLKQIGTRISSEIASKSFISPKRLAVDISKISLYEEAIAARLRGVKKSEHWFTYLVIRKGADSF